MTFDGRSQWYPPPSKPRPLSGGLQARSKRGAIGQTWWSQRFIDVLIFLAKLLAGEMPAEVEDAFAACDLTLFPASVDDLDTACSCPGWANPCKHVAAVYYLLAEAFDADPFLIFAWRGRGRDELLASLRARRGGGPTAPMAKVDDNWPTRCCASSTRRTSRSAASPSATCHPRLPCACRRGGHGPT